MSGTVESVRGTEVRRFKPYAEYRDSGVEWLGKIPAHWEVKRLKRSVRIQGGGTPTKDNLEYWRGGIPWVSPKDMKVSLIQDTEDKITADAVRESATKLIPPGAVLIVVRSGILTRTIPVAIAGRELTLNQDLKAMIPSRELCSEYLRYLIAGVQRELLVEWRKEGATVESLELELVTNTPIPIPSIGDQYAVTTFLDRETARIDALVVKNERLIELLLQKRTALITRAVTRGLDRNVPMKDSGVDWLGDIPAHWDCLALSRVTASRCDGPFGSGLKSEHYAESGVRVVRLQNIGWTEFIDCDQAYIDEVHAHQLGDHSVRGGDLLIAGLGDDSHPVGRACVAPDRIEPAMVKADCFRFRLNEERILPQFAALQLSATASAAAGAFATGATRARMNLTATASKKVALPPLCEQQAIVDAVDRESESYPVLVAKIGEAITRLKEFRTALISAAVTGKIDVRQETA